MPPEDDDSRWRLADTMKRMVTPPNSPSAPLAPGVTTTILPPAPAPQRFPPGADMAQVFAAADRDGSAILTDACGQARIRVGACLGNDERVLEDLQALDEPFFDEDHPCGVLGRPPRDIALVRDLLAQLPLTDAEIEKACDLPVGRVAWWRAGDTNCDTIALLRLLIAGRAAGGYGVR